MATIVGRPSHRIFRGGIAILLGVVPTSGTSAGQLDPVVTARFMQLTRATT